MEYYFAVWPCASDTIYQVLNVPDYKVFAFFLFLNFKGKEKNIFSECLLFLRHFFWTIKPVVYLHMELFSRIKVWDGPRMKLSHGPRLLVQKLPWLAAQRDLYGRYIRPPSKILLSLWSRVWFFSGLCTVFFPTDPISECLVYDFSISCLSPYPFLMKWSYFPLWCGFLSLPLRHWAFSSELVTRRYCKFIVLVTAFKKFKF